MARRISRRDSGSNGCLGSSHRAPSRGGHRSVLRQPFADDVAVGHHPDQPVVLSNRNGTYIMLTHQFCEFGNRGVRTDPVDALVHRVLDFHGGPPLLELDTLDEMQRPRPSIFTVQRIRSAGLLGLSGGRAQSGVGIDIDYKRLLSEFHSRGYLLRAFYYTAVTEDQEYSSIRPLIDWLDYNGYSVVTKATKEFVDQTGRRKVKGNMDIELAVDAMEIAGSIDHMVLFSGDGDFRSLVEAVQRRGVRVTVVSTISTQPPMVAAELRRQADIFLDIVELQPKIGRDPAERGTREAREPHDRHTPQFLQRPTAPQPAGAGAPLDDDDDFED